MKDYDYESLGADMFQQLAQAVLVKLHPDVQCLPVGMPDGGRDASVPGDRAQDSIVYQVKFRKPTPNRSATPDEICSWLQKAITKELPKLRRLEQRGTTKYIVITNAQCSSHEDAGTFDRMSEWMRNNLPIPSQIWWRDDVSRRLDGEIEIKRTYGLLRDLDGLMELLGYRSPESTSDSLIRTARTDPRIAALIKALRFQYGRDRIVKFKQADLNPELLDVFVDTPTAALDVSVLEVQLLMLSAQAESDSPGESFARWRGIIRPKSEEAYSVRENNGPPAASLLLAGIPPAASKNLSRFVLEGAPGQGKSTVGQYLCQVHRARLLGHEDVARFPSNHRSSPLRLPFHVDLRDLATWLRKKDPFDITNAGKPRDWIGSVESFLAAQVREYSGGMAFSVTDLDAIISATPILIILDGLDEVADVGDRKAVVAAVNDAFLRLEHSCPDMRLIATSRPNAFSKSPGFPKKDYTYLSLADLPLGLVLNYTDGWLRAKNIVDREALNIRKALGDKLSQSHIIDLARNPMQLAILLWLVQRKGSSLPDKRTALYNAYIDTFLDREAEKSNIVRDKRDLILELHGYIAWHLHCKAEAGKSSGNISEPRLKGLMKRYLTSEGYDTEIVDQLFTGMTQRVMVLTSRIEGTFEFEVQPLREYFAARFLYSTARPSPPGAEHAGTRSDRFESLVRNPYWLNVMRFFAGFSDKGELANILDLIEALQADSEFGLTGYPRHIAAVLLRDQVFSQKPKIAQSAMEMVANSQGISLLSTAWFGSGEILTVNKDSGAAGMADLMRAQIEKTPRFERCSHQACRVLVENTDGAETVEWWFARATGLTGIALRHWVRAGQFLHVFQALTPEQISQLIAGSPDDNQLWQILIMSNALDISRLNGFERGKFLESLRTTIGLEFRPYIYFTRGVRAFEFVSSHNFVKAMLGEYRGASSIAESTTRLATTAEPADDPVTQVACEIAKLVERAENLVGLDCLQVLQEAHDLIVRLLGSGPRSDGFALGAGFARGGGVTRAVAGNLLDKSIHPVLRARFARTRRSDAEWWRSQSTYVSSEEDARWVISSAMAYSGHEVVAIVCKELDRWMRSMDVGQAELLASISATSGYHQSSPTVSYGQYDGLRISPVGLLLLSQKVPPAEAVSLLRSAVRKSKTRELKAYISSALVTQILESPNPYESLDELRAAGAESMKGSVSFKTIRGHVRVPTLSQAKAVLADPKNLPDRVIWAADRELMGHLGAKAIPLSRVAERDKWFDDSLAD
ncbi:NACHT domain-containing protein [Kitasatospora sp. NPDC059648]|uniref:NACHT domain-containing protein n=1 Tax=Kitasatospora sp. NPDC059648 TaxID=3346894 RepID=UPI0036B8B4D8